MSNDEPLSGKERILAATVRVILRDGVLALTLDSVAREAGMSKGGFLYHFASKELLIRALIEQFISRYEQRMQELRGEDPQPRGRWTRAFLRASSEELSLPHEAASPACLRRVFFSLLATTVLSPELSVVTQELSERWRADMAADGVEPVEQMLLMAASDGILFWEMIRVMMPDDPLRPQLLSTLQERGAALGAASETQPRLVNFP
jgi:AcrR family transcriptional regulator